MIQGNLNAAVAAFNLGEYLWQFGAEPGDTEWLLTCPHCGKLKLAVNVSKKTWHCWVCQSLRTDARGGLLDLMVLLEDISRVEAAERVIRAADAGLTIDHIGYRPLVSQEPVLIPEPVAIAPPDHWTTELGGMLEYCQKRGISSQDITDFGLFWCSNGRYANRLVFPVWEKGVLVYWQARAMWEESQHSSGRRYIKSLNPPKNGHQLSAGEVLFNLDQASCYERVAITEGPIDAVHVGLDAGATFGKKISDIQIAKLLRAGVRAVDLMWDGPTALEPHGAWPEMIRAGERLQGLFDVSLIFIPRGDPGDYSRSELAQIREQCRKPLGSNRLERI